jgi:hypothetical protein
MMSHLLLASTTSWSGVAAARRKVGFPPTNPHTSRTQAAHEPHTSRTQAAASQHAHTQKRTGCLHASLLSVLLLAALAVAWFPAATLSNLALFKAKSCAMTNDIRTKLQCDSSGVAYDVVGQTK